MLAFFGFFSGDALMAGFALEIVPTHYRATVSGLRYLVDIGAGAVALALEGRLYDHFQAPWPRHPVVAGHHPDHPDRDPVPARTGGENPGGNAVVVRAV